MDKAVYSPFKTGGQPDAAVQPEGPLRFLPLLFYQI